MINLKKTAAAAIEEMDAALEQIAYNCDNAWDVAEETLCRISVDCQHIEGPIPTALKRRYLMVIQAWLDAYDYDAATGNLEGNLDYLWGQYVAHQFVSELAWDGERVTPRLDAALDRMEDGDYREGYYWAAAMDANVLGD